jgi:hypothetical protein
LGGGGGGGVAGKNFNRYTGFLTIRRFLKFNVT